MKGKNCTRCKQLLPTTQFRLSKRLTYKKKKTGETVVYFALRCVCKGCQNKIISERNKINPTKNRARSLVRSAIKSGKLKKNPCVICGEIKVEGHHPDHNKALEVVWLCRRHHREEENRLIKLKLQNAKRK